MRRYLRGFFYSMPIQMLLLHLRSYQLLLLFWYILFAQVNGSLMAHFGVNNLFLAPEYLNNTNPISTAILGTAFTVFIMSWNVTTFILHSKHIKFLATTTQPFLKYCINNSIIPLSFITFYYIKAYHFLYSQELFSNWEIIFLLLGFLCGIIIALAVAFGYFFGADRTIYRFLPSSVKEELTKHKAKFSNGGKKSKSIVHIEWFVSATLKLRQPRDVTHYSEEFIDRIFKQHHIAAIISIMLAFGSLIILGFFLDNKYFQLPAAASFTVFIAILIAVAGAFSYFLKTWTVPVAIVILAAVNWMYENDIIDPKNKAYGINYENKNLRPSYDEQTLLNLCSEENRKKDSLNFIEILNRWKQKQQNPRPVMYVISTSGGGTRAATFTMHVLQKLNNLSQDRLMNQTSLITGSSGGMMGAAYFRELYREKLFNNTINLSDSSYAEDISTDLMNSLFSSYVARDIIGPPQHFKVGEHRYIKDRGYAFEEKLNEITHGKLNKQLKDYVDAELRAQIPLAFFNSVITRDGRRMTISTQPASFMMYTSSDTSGSFPFGIDGVDFVSYFKNQNPYDLRLLTAIRMSATFPYVLPSVWLPTKPVIDVMDAGFRDNTGVQTALKFLFEFREWIKQNCSKLVLIQIVDKRPGGWDFPFESKTMIDLLTNPAILTQYNLFRFQEYEQNESLQYLQEAMGLRFQRIVFAYKPMNKEFAASLSFHLSSREKNDVKSSLNDTENQQAFRKFQLQ